MSKQDREIRIGICASHTRSNERKACEGIAAFVRDRPNWRLTMFSNRHPLPAELSGFDGFIWDVVDEKTAEILTATGKPVIDLANDGKFPGTISVGADHVVCGQLAARHFISHHITNFAFCGWRKLRFSEARQKSFERAIALNRYACSHYLSSAISMRKFARSIVDVLALPEDASAIGRWLQKLPKPIGVFCANDLRAWQVNEICRRGKLAVPGQVAILGADNDSVSCLFTNPTISSVDIDAFGSGYQAAVTLANVLSGHRSPNDKTPVLVPPKGVESRMSTAVYPVEPPWLSEAVMYIRENVAKALIASEVAARVGRSYVTVENAFKAKLGTTIQKEIMSSRLETAQHLLAATHRPLAEIAKLSGFRSVQYLCLCFQRSFGRSPLAYRQSAAH